MPTRIPLREKDAKTILANFRARLDLGEELFGSKPRVEKVQLQNEELILVNGKPTILKKGEKLIPALKFDNAIQRLVRVVVDMGAVPHICNGADVMAKGIRRIEGEFAKGALVVIIDETYGKPLAIGEALEDSVSIRAMERGKAISNLHFVGDKAWDTIKTTG